MFVKSFLNMASLLVIAGSTGVVFAGSEQKSPYVDDEGYCVVDIHPSNLQKYVQQKVIDVPDTRGHEISVFKVEQKISDTKLCHDDSLVLVTWYGMTDYVDHDGTHQGYGVFMTEKGDQVFVKFTGNSQMKEGEDLAKDQSTGRIIGGVGALSAAEGNYQYLDRFNRHKEIIKPVMDKLRYKIVAKDAKK